MITASSWVWRYKLGTPVFGKFLPFFSWDPLNLCQVGSGASLYIYFQVSPEMFDRVQLRALAAPLKDIQRLVTKPLLRCLGCVLRVVGLLEGEPLPQSEVLSALEQVFIKDLSVLTFPNHVQSIECTTGGLQLSCRNISRMIYGNWMHPSSISSLTPKGLNTYVNKVFLFKYLMHLQKCQKIFFHFVLMGYCV